jgi:hypothetical protein
MLMPEAAPARPAPAEEPDETLAASALDDASLEASGFVRDERGLRYVGEAAD